MADPHNPKRYGELWQERPIEVLYRRVLEPIREHVVVSGGWAWHLMSPLNHPEYKHAHDHKDIDAFALPEKLWSLIDILERKLHLRKTATRHDKKRGNENYRRYTGRIEGVDVVLDLFVKDVPSFDLQGFKVVDPKYLLSLYGKIHGSDKCIAVVEAKKLVDAGISPVGRQELVTLPRG